MSTIDLHSHSKYSPDGELTPAAIVKRAHEHGVHTMAITDHNSARGVAEGLTAADPVPGMRCIPGIEIDASWEGLNLHILGLGIDHTAPVFADIEANALVQETKFCLQLAEGFQALGLQLNSADLLKDTPNLAPEFLFRRIMDEPANRDHERVKPYLPGGARSDMPIFNMYRDYCLPGQLLYIPRYYMELDDALAAIKEHRGTSFLAHPGGSLTDFETQIPALYECGVEGIEAFSTYHSDEQNRQFAAQAKALGMLISCGSDFHGTVKPTIELGQVNDSGYEADIARSVEQILSK